MSTPIEPGQWVRWKHQYRPIKPLWDDWAMVESIYKYGTEDGQWLAVLSKYDEDTGEITEHKVLARALTTDGR